MAAIASVAGLLGSSTAAAVLRKVLFQMDGLGLHHHVHHFEKPYFTTWESALALVVCLPLYWIGLLIKRTPASHTSAHSDIEQPLLEKETLQGSTSGGQEQGRKPFKTWAFQILALSVPGILNVASIVVQGIGLQYISATVSLMLMGSTILFTAVLSTIFLKCRLHLYHITGIVLTLLGVVLVGVANLFFISKGSNSLKASMPETHRLWSGAASEDSPRTDSGNAMLGVTLTLLGALALAGRLIADELALEGTDLHPFQVLGYEGVWGTIVSSVVIYPIAWFIPGHDEGARTENILDTLVMLADRDVSIVNAFFFLAVVGMNVFGLFVTSKLGSVFRAVLLTARTASVWVVDLVLFYAHVGGGHIGEGWINPTSYIQLAGFALILVGTIIYAQGSSVVALLLANTKSSESPAVTGADRLSQSSFVTQLRPLTSLYIPNVPVRQRTSMALASSLPTDIVWPHLGGAFHLTHSVPSNIALAVGPTRASGTIIADNQTSHSATPTTTHSADIPVTVRGVSPLSPLSSGQFFLQTLTDRSSWMLGSPETPRRRESNGLQEHQQHSMEYRTDPSFDLENADTRIRQSVSGRNTTPLPTAFGEVENDPIGSFTFTIDPEPQDNDDSQEAKLPPTSSAGHPSSDPVEKPVTRIPGIPASVEVGKAAAKDGNKLLSPGKGSIEGMKAPESPAAHTLAQAHADKSPDADRAVPEIQAGHVYGQSPTPEVLQQQRSATRTPRQQLAALPEAPDDDSENETTPENAGQQAEEVSNSDGGEDDWLNLDSHKILFADSDSDVSLGSDGILTGRRGSSDQRRNSSDRRSSLSLQGSRSLQDVDPAQFKSQR